MKKTSNLYNYFSATFAFFLWGGWAFYINNSSDQISQITSGLTQGICSFVTTLLLTHIVVYFYNKIQHPIIRFWVSPLITVFMTSAILINIHMAIDTPEIFFTILPTIVVALIYAFITVSKVHFQQA